MRIESAIIEKSINAMEKAMHCTYTPQEISVAAEETPSRCLNCSAALAEGVRYCPQCGQAADTGRLGNKALVIDLLGTLTRLNKGVFYTCLNLLRRPWRVIADYMHGQRVNYTDPVKLLLGLCFILLSLEAMFHLDQSEPAPYPAEDAYDGLSVKGFILFFMESDTLQYLMAFLPVVPVMMFVNRRNKVCRYNMAECLVGALYMSDAMLVIKLLCLPVLALGIDVSSEVVFLYLAVTGSVLVYKSLGHFGYSHRQRRRKTVMAIILMGLSYLLLFIVMCLIFVLWIIVTRGGLPGVTIEQ